MLTARRRSLCQADVNFLSFGCYDARRVVGVSPRSSRAQDANLKAWPLETGRWAALIQVR